MASAFLTAERMYAITRQLFEPCNILVNYTLLQYLMIFYWTRRGEPWVGLLFVVGIVGVACLVPFANPNSDLTSGLNDVSESCCVLVFLIQITILGRDLNKKMKFKTVLYLTWIAEILIFADLVMVVFSLVSVLWPEWLGEKHASLKEDIPNVCENLNLAFIFFFRFYYTVQSRGWREIVTKRKCEVLCYLLFATHEVPFTVLEDVTKVSWEHVQATWNRVTLAGCLYITATTKLRDRSSLQSNVESMNPKSSQGHLLKRTRVPPRNANVYVVVSARPDEPSIKQDSVQKEYNR